MDNVVVVERDFIAEGSEFRMEKKTEHGESHISTMHSKGLVTYVAEMAEARHRERLVIKPIPRPASPTAQ